MTIRTTRATPRLGRGTTPAGPSGPADTPASTPAATTAATPIGADPLDGEPASALQDLGRRRVEAAGLHDLARPGAGSRRRAALTELTTRALQRAWTGCGAPADGVALAAVGSLARGDGGPMSDLDLILLHDGRLPDERLGELAERLWYPLWDSGVRLDHSVRTVAECRAVAREDLVAAVGLLDLRHLAGDPVLVAGARPSLARDWRADARTRLPELVSAVGERHTRHGELADLLEPDLKEARGGLRDLTIVSALTAAWLADAPRGAVDAARERLLDVRDALHLATGRGRERLVAQDRDAVAALLGYSGGDDLLRDVAESGRAAADALDATLRRAGQAQRARALRVGPRRPALTPLGHGLSEHDGEIVLGARTDPAADPLLALRAARASARTGLPLSPATTHNLATQVPKLPRPWPPAARDLLGDVLAAGEGLATTWESLTLAGVVEAWIPAWSGIRSRPQHNPVHRHTVDRHSVQTAIATRPLLADVRRPDLLVLAALLHDVGKAYGTDDHALLGAEPARESALALGFDAADADVVALLVAEHLTLVDLATRRDPDDPRTVDLLCEAVRHDPDVLELLRALTEADARAAGPAAWSTWRARLVDELTGAARACLEASLVAGGEAAAATGGSGAATAGRAGDAADAGGTPALTAPSVRIPPEREARWVDAPEHARAAARATGAVVTVEQRESGFLVEVVARDRLGLFADTAGLLAAGGLGVRRAQLTTLHGLAVDRWYVESPTGTAPDPRALERSLARLAAGDRRGLAPLARRARAATSGAVGAPAPRALLVPGASEDATVLELRAPDRPGLLHDVGRALVDAGVSVRSAHVATSCGQAVDTVYVTDPAGGPLGPAQVARVVAALMDAAAG
ncbi:[protein-PII] uridylyltransferase [Agilicoccus flavus]|uniref:[protein-PII] uridylyltransferase n=1 Tax=Agilicoccus flavus TaxID=2775968 RepID=UPI001CF6A1E2|nr:[protein-PII] uridylyltransferase [Agilicoccus flavus]